MSGLRVMPGTGEMTYTERAVLTRIDVYKRQVLYDQNNTGYRNLQNQFEDNLRSLEFYE